LAEKSKGEGKRRPLGRERVFLQGIGRNGRTQVRESAREKCNCTPETNLWWGESRKQTSRRTRTKVTIKKGGPKK